MKKDKIREIKQKLKSCIICVPFARKIGKTNSENKLRAGSGSNEVSETTE